MITSVVFLLSITMDNDIHGRFDLLDSVSNFINILPLEPQNVLVLRHSRHEDMDGIDLLISETDNSSGCPQCVS